ncbi:zonadhesin-like [Nomia melanderi]|uniref:zonadhesin-like n=1 Tax=Nomia melanderi TaxID=2448451 RepID=UPI0013045B0E|nr:zonadhesin-like [Nomia melanderi]
MNQIVAMSFVVLFLCLTYLPNDVLTAPGDTKPSTEGPIKCDRNEEPTDCVACMPTCERPFPGICQGPICKPGCKCKPGYLKDTDNDCVSIIGCIIDNIRRDRPWSISDFMKPLQKKNN